MLGPGTAVGRYVINRKLAEGGMAEIFLASAQGAEGFSKDVVIKVVKEFLSADSQFVQMFIAEARLASRLNHANVVQIFDFGKHDDSYYLTMEYVRGASLWELRKRSRELGTVVPPVLSAEIITQVARGLQYAHALTERGEKLGVVHRDVTPHNVLLSFDGAVKLTDFGIAKATTTHTVPGMLKGKFAYMSPEQGRGEKVDARTDIFALGIVLWELLTGGRLFDGDSDLAMLRAVQETLIPPPSRLNPEVPTELSDIVMKALARPLDERFQSAFEFEKALANWVLRNAQSVEDTDVGGFLRTMFAREYDQAPESTQLPGGASALVDDDFGLGETLARPAKTAMTATPIKQEPLRGALDDADAVPQRTEEFKSPRGTEAMPALKRVSSRRLAPLPPPRPSALEMPPQVDDARTHPPRPVPEVSASFQSSQVRPTQPHDVMADEAPLKAPRSPVPLILVSLGALALLGGGLWWARGDQPEATAVVEAPPAVDDVPAEVAPPEPSPTPEAPLPEKPQPVAAVAPAETPTSAPVAEPVAKRPAVEPKNENRSPRRATGTLTVRAVPFATVTVQGKQHEVVGTRNLQVPVGAYEITLSHPRKTVKEQVTVKAGAVTSVTFSAN